MSDPSPLSPATGDEGQAARVVRAADRAAELLVPSRGYPIAIAALLLVALALDVMPIRQVPFAAGAVALQLVAVVAVLVDLRRRRFGLARGGVRAAVLNAAAFAVMLLFTAGRATLVFEWSVGWLDRALAVEALREYAAVVLVAGALVLYLRGETGEALIGRLSLRPVQTVVFSFGAAILAGALVLALPFSVVSADRISLLDALFVATSAVCVTGLSVVDVAATYTRFGQGVLLVLIQAGGLGIMALYAAFAAVAGSRLNARREQDLSVAAGVDLDGGLRRSLRFIIGATVGIELAGALLLYPVFARGGAPDPAWNALFHAVSAFCNAGFSTLPRGLLDYQGSVAALGLLSVLVVLGGIGYPVLASAIVALRSKRLPRGLHVKLALWSSGVLLALGFVGLLAFEWSGSLRGLGFGERLLNAFFQSVSARTAGFNAVDLSHASAAGAAFTMALMLVGASPASTGGGLKTTTIAVLGLTLAAVLRRRSEVRAFGRAVSSDDVFRATAVAGSGLLMLGVGALALLALEDLPAHALLFEAVSAFSTTGLSLGITPQLDTGARLVVIALMFAGRLGSLTLLSAFLERREEGRVRYPRENVLFG